MITDYFCLAGQNTAPVTGVCDVSDSYVSELDHCPLEESDSGNRFICSSACIYYSDCPDAD